MTSDSPSGGALAEKKARLVAELTAIRDSQERFSWLVQRARQLPSLDLSDKADANRVSGCDANLWILREFHGGQCFYRCDSDSQVVKAVAGLLCEFYSGATPNDIVSTDASFLYGFGIRQHLTANRRNALSRVWEVIRDFARNHLLRLYDAHNHLQDERLQNRQDELVAQCEREGVVKMIVNGACEADWPQVAVLARKHPHRVLPAFGYHPWYVHERTADWQRALVRWLDEVPGAVIGEIGLDRWKPGLSYDDQEEVFLWQLRLAAERDLPVSIHCLQAWGRFYELLRAGPRPLRGLLLHSYGGSREMVAPLAELGAYFSFPGYFIHERKRRQREAFQAVPKERLLIETDAPDQLLPQEHDAHSLTDAAGKPLNHPANLSVIYRFVAEMRGEPLEKLASQVEDNFQRVFG